jgi:hypothetical protein
LNGETLTPNIVVKPVGPVIMFITERNEMPTLSKEYIYRSEMQESLGVLASSGRLG